MMTEGNSVSKFLSALKKAHEASLAVKEAENIVGEELGEGVFVRGTVILRIKKKSQGPKAGEYIVEVIQAQQA